MCQNCTLIKFDVQAIGKKTHFCHGKVRCNPYTILTQITQQGS
jgi:hypothetical protein